jgi:hypothetical protein
VGYVPNIITAAADRLETGIGNWTTNMIQGTGTFLWADGAELLQTSAPPVKFDAILEKDFFPPIDITALYTVTLDIFWPSDSPGLIGLIFGINGGTPFFPSFEPAETPYDIWRQALSNFTFESTFDNDLRQLYFRFNSLEAAAHVFVKNLSIRKWSEAKVQYLPIMGIG